MLVFHGTGYETSWTPPFVGADEGPEEKGSP